jgi:hypothetical protein
MERHRIRYVYEALAVIDNTSRCGRSFHISNANRANVGTLLRKTELPSASPNRV